MPEFEVVAPNGAKFRITAPDGATHQQALEYARAQFESMASPQKDAPKPMSDNGASWGAVQNTAHGVLQGLGDEIMAATAAAKESLGGGLPFGKAYDQALSMYRGAKEKYQQQNPVESFLTEGAGSIASGLGAGGALRAAGVAMPAATSAMGRLAQNAGAGAAMGGAYGFNEGEGGFANRAENAGKVGAMGGFVGGAVPAVSEAASRVISPVRSKLTPELSRLAEVAKAEGIELTPGQMTNSTPLKTMESAFESLPLTAAPQQAIKEQQQKAFTRAVMKRAGEDSESAAPEVLQKAQGRIGGEFDRLAKGSTIALDDKLISDLGEAEAKYSMNLPPDQQAIVRNYVDSILSQGSDMPGEVYQKARSQMTRRAKNATDPELRSALKDVRNSLDDAADRSITQADRESWDTARRQYANLKTIEKAMGNSQNPTTAGYIPPTALSGAVRSGNTAFARGAGDLNDLARVGTAFVRDNIPNSGTAQRTMMQNLLTGGTVGGAGVMAGANPTALAAMIGGGMILPRAIQGAYNSQAGRNYLTNNVVDRLAAERLRQALGRQAAIAGGAVSGGLLDYGQ